MDQAALQRVTLARSSGTLCWTARGAREQQSLRTWIVSFFFGLDGIQLAHSVGEWSLFWIPRLNPLAATLQCTAGIVLRRRHSGSTWTVLQVILQLGALWQCTFKKLLYSCGRRPLVTQCFTDSACCDRIVLPFDLARYSYLPSDEVADHDWSPTLPYVTVLATATELLPAGGAVQ